MNTLLLLGLLATAAPAENPLTITVVNYSRWPVHATTVTLDEKLFGGPARFFRSDTGAAVPILRDASGVRLFVSLPPSSRLELVAQPAARWPENRPVEARADLLYNGVVRLAFGKRGWKFGFDAENAALIEDGTLDFWIDTQNRGRITNADAAYLQHLGLTCFSTAPIEKTAAAVGPDGRPRITRSRRLGAMTVTETFELAPGMPLLLCRVRWQNEGDTPAWVAYVGSGSGIAGRWSKDLMRGPLIERKKSPTQGDINGSETRPAWVGQLCRISMESPATGCGVGLSTLLPMPNKVGQGSMIWGCGAGGFQCNFLDPVQGQFPFLVPPHASLENGFAFLAAETGLSVFRQTQDLWKALQSEQLPKLAPPCAVFVRGEPVCPQTISGVENCTDRKLALRLDFNKHFQCRVQGATQVLANRQVLFQSTLPSSGTIDLNERLPGRDELAVVLETNPGATVSVVETLPVAPTMLSPVAAAQMTDLAAMFRWAGIPLVVDYELQWARTEDFAAPSAARVASSGEYPWYLVPEDRLPAPGRWYWRIRGLKEGIVGAWSPTRSFTVNNDHATKPLKRPLTPRNPLFTLEATRVLDYTNFRPDVPADIAPYVGIIAEGMEGQGVPVTQFARGMDKLPHAILLRSHWVGLADIEWLFQHVPNFVGIQGGEHLSSLYRDKDDETRYHHRLTRLCAKYGMFYQEADGTYKDDKWQELMDRQGPFVRQYGPYLVLTQKNNIIRRQFYSQSAALGLWLGGITHGHGAWEDGGFYWQNAGFNGLGVCAGERSGVLRTMPRIFWDLVCVMGISRGCTIFSLDGQTLMTSAKLVARQPDADWPSAIWYDTGKTTDTFQRFVAPLIRGTVRHNLVPTKEEVLHNVRVAVFNDKQAPGDERAWPHYAEYGPLFAGTYGFRKMGTIDGQLWEFFPNTGRYYFIPVLPQGNEPLAPGIRNIPVSALQTVARVKETFDAAYPAWYEGDALVCRIGDTLTIQNTRENEDVTESYAVPLTRGWLRSIAGRIAPHSYLLGKLEDQGREMWLQANTEYPERDTALSLTCARKADCQVTPAAAAREVRWDDATHTLHLRLAHEQGAVEVHLK